MLQSGGQTIKVSSTAQLGLRYEAVNQRDWTALLGPHSITSYRSINDEEIKPIVNVFITKKITGVYGVYASHSV